MSTTQLPGRVYDCDRNGCTETFPSGHAVEGSFCSEECYHHYRGDKLLKNLRDDHTVCANCGTKCKEVEPPKPDYAFDKTGTGWSFDPASGQWGIEWYSQEETRKAAIGFQYRTRRADPDEFAIVCGNCGNCTLSKPFPESQAIFLEEYSRGLLDALDRRRERGEHDKEFNRDVFFEFLETRHDIPIALGRAIED